MPSGSADARIDHTRAFISPWRTQLAREQPSTPGTRNFELRASGPTLESERAVADSSSVEDPLSSNAASQVSLPGFGLATSSIRQTVLGSSLKLLGSHAALTRSEISQRLAQLDDRIDVQLVDSVLSSEGARHVRYDLRTDGYRLARRN